MKGSAWAGTSGHHLSQIWNVIFLGGEISIRMFAFCNLENLMWNITFTIPITRLKASLSETISADWSQPFCSQNIKLNSCWKACWKSLWKSHFHTDFDQPERNSFMDQKAWTENKTFWSNFWKPFRQLINQTSPYRNTSSIYTEMSWEI